MNILIVGCGDTGSQLANVLDHMGNQVSVVDRNPETAAELSDSFTGMFTVGVPIDQDVLGIPCRRVYTNGMVDILARPLSDKRLAVCFFNKSPKSHTVKAQIEEFCELSYFQFPKAAEYLVQEITEDMTFSTCNELVASVPSHGVKVFVISAKDE